MAEARDPQSLVMLVTSPQVLGLVIQRARKASGMSQREAARRCGVGPRFLVDVENGKATVRLDKVMAVMNGVGLMTLVLPVEYLQAFK